MVFQNTIEPQNGVHGRAQLMTHRGNEFILVALRADQFLVNGLEFIATCAQVIQLFLLTAIQEIQNENHAQRSLDFDEQIPKNKIGGGVRYCRHPIQL